MPRTIITSKSGVVIRVGNTPVANENVIINTTTYKISVTAEIDGRAIISALDDFWHAQPGMSLYRFPAYAIDETSAKYQIGYDGNLYNAWQWEDLATKKNIKSIGWKQHNIDGTVAEEWFGVTTPPGGVPDTAQPYYQTSANGSPVNFAFTGSVNEAVQVYGDSAHGNFDARAFFKVFAREQGYVFASSDLSSVSRSATGPYSQAFGLTVSSDDKITHIDSVVNSAPYTLLALTYYNADQSRSIGGTAYPFRIIIDNSTANLNRFQIYERLQYLMRQSTDVDAGSGTVVGKTAEQIVWFVGTTLYSTAAIDGLDSNDINDVVIIDKNGVQLRHPYASAGKFNFNSLISSASSAKYSVVFYDPTATAGDEWGAAGGILVNDKDGNPLAGSIGGAAFKNWSFDYDGNSQGGRAPGTDADCVIIVTSPGNIRYKSQKFTITRATGQNVDVNGSEPPYYLS